MSADERARVQIALAEAFVDSIVDYAHIAERIQDFDLKFVEKLYSEVALSASAILKHPFHRFGLVSRMNGY